MHALRLALARAAALLGLVAACDGSRGQVELNWSVVDAAAEPMFPQGPLADLCGFVGRTAEGGPQRGYDLRVQLRLCDPDCPQDCADAPECQRDVFQYPCKSARGFSTVLAQPYDFEVDLVARFSDTCACELGPACALVPGPRTRTVEAGLVTDLQVFQLVLVRLLVDPDDSPPDPIAMDLDGCCELPPDCS